MVKPVQRGPAPRWIITTGQRFGRGSVITEIRMPGGGRHKTVRGVRLICDCGKEYQTRLQDLVSSAKHPTQSCGCLMRETAAKTMSRPENIARLAALSHSKKTRAATAASNKVRKRTHGLSRMHPLYSTWVNMKSRCYNPNWTQYKDWGGRGITVCERWHDARLFIEDIECLIGPRPPGMTLDRIDNDGNYEPGNVRWATRAEQIRNSRPKKTSKLTPDDVLTIRRRLVAGDRTRVIAQDYSVSDAAIHLIKIGKNWRSVQLPP